MLVIPSATTDSTGGTVGTSLSTMTGTYSADYVNLNNNLATLASLVNTLLTIVTALALKVEDKEP